MRRILLAVAACLSGLGSGAAKDTDPMASAAVLRLLCIIIARWQLTKLYARLTSQDFCKG